MGRPDDCRRHVTEAVEIAQSSNLVPVEVFGAAALGLLASGERDHEAAAAHFSVVRDSLESAGLRHPGIVAWAAELIEALHRLGDTDAAARLLAEHEQRVTDTRDRTGELGVLRCRIRTRPGR